MHQPDVSGLSFGTAVGTKLEIRVQGAATGTTKIGFRFCLPWPLISGIRQGDAVAPLTDNIRRPLFDSEERNEKKTQVAVASFQICLKKTTAGASDRPVVKHHCSGRNTADDKHVTFYSHLTADAQGNFIFCCQMATGRIFCPGRSNRLTCQDLSI